LQELERVAKNMLIIRRAVRMMMQTAWAGILCHGRAEFLRMYFGL